MRRQLILGLAAAGLVVTMLPAVASGDPQSNNSHAALIVRDESCYLFGADGTQALHAGKLHFVENNGSQQWTCRGIVPNTRRRAVRWDTDTNPSGTHLDYLCLEVRSTSWHQTISPKGRSTLKVSCPTRRS